MKNNNDDNLTEEEKSILEPILELAVHDFGIKKVPNSYVDFHTVDLIWHHMFRKDTLLFMTIKLDRQTKEVKYILETTNEYGEHDQESFLTTLQAIDLIKRNETQLDGTLN